MKTKVEIDPDNPKKLNITMPMIGLDYEYHLMFWGGVKNDNWIERDLGIKENNFWFETEKERSEFKNKLQEVANNHKQVICFDENEGQYVRYRTIAKMIMVLNDTEYPYEYDFGFAYSKDSAEYMFEEGNYSCDCNKSIFLSKKYPKVPEIDCGDTIELKDFKIIFKFQGDE